MTEELSDRENRQLEPNLSHLSQEKILSFWTETEKRFIVFHRLD